MCAKSTRAMALVRPSRRPLRGLLRMKNNLSANPALPRPEERAAARVSKDAGWLRKRDRQRKAPFPFRGRGQSGRIGSCETAALIEDREVREEADAVAVAGADTEAEVHVGGIVILGGFLLGDLLLQRLVLLPLALGLGLGGGELGGIVLLLPRARSVHDLLVLLLHLPGGGSLLLRLRGLPALLGVPGGELRGGRIEERGMLLGGQITGGSLGAGRLPGGDGGAAAGAEDAVGAAGA